MSARVVFNHQLSNEMVISRPSESGRTVSGRGGFFAAPRTSLAAASVVRQSTRNRTSKANIPAATAAWQPAYSQNGQMMVDTSAADGGFKEWFATTLAVIDSREGLDKRKLDLAESAEIEDAQARCEREEEAGSIRFWFVKRDFVLQQQAVLPALQQLLRENPDALEKLHISRSELLSDAPRHESMLVVSHRWESKAAPDTHGEQLKQIHAHLRENTQLTHVWYDYWCMPQHPRRPGEQVEFDHMLWRMDWLFLRSNVLILLDISYLSRFWTQFEAWLSMQRLTPNGFEPERDPTRRCVIRTLHNANARLEKFLVDLWSLRTPQQACAILAAPDVLVTNQKDKDSQIQKIMDIIGALDSTISSPSRARGGKAPSLEA